MNILTVSHDFSIFRFRPDSTLIRAQDSYYLPDYVKGLRFAPVVCFRCSRPGKSVDKKFAGRYVDSFGYGILLFPDLSEDIQESREFISNALDFTSIIPLNFRPMSDYGSFRIDNENSIPAHRLKAAINGHPVIESPSHPSYDMIGDIISRLTRFCATRTGDLISYELAEPIAVGGEDKITLFSGNTLLTELTIL